MRYASVFWGYSEVDRDASIALTNQQKTKYSYLALADGGGMFGGYNAVFRQKHLYQFTLPSGKIPLAASTGMFGGFYKELNDLPDASTYRENDYIMMMAPLVDRGRCVTEGYGPDDDDPRELKDTLRIMCIDNNNGYASVEEFDINKVGDKGCRQQIVSYSDDVVRYSYGKKIRRAAAATMNIYGDEKHETLLLFVSTYAEPREIRGELIQFATEHYGKTQEEWQALSSISRVIQFDGSGSSQLVIHGDRYSNGYDCLIDCNRTLPFGFIVGESSVVLAGDKQSGNFEITLPEDTFSNLGNVKKLEIAGKEIPFQVEANNKIAANAYNGTTLTVKSLPVSLVAYNDEGQKILDMYYPFKDVAPGEWYSKAIIWGWDKGVINGYKDGSFDFGRNVTRAELLKIMIETNELLNPTSNNYAPTDTVFPDVTKDHWASGYIQYAKANDIVHGYGEGVYKGLFVPENLVNRAEAAKIIVRIFEHITEPNNDICPSKFGDVADGEWYCRYLTALADIEAPWTIINGYGPEGNKTFKPVGNMNRAEAIITACRSYAYAEGETGLCDLP